MSIVVTIKQVIDPNLLPSYIDIGPGGKRIIAPFGVLLLMNGYDANALEAALKLKEQHGGRVTAVEQPLRESRTIQHKRLPAYRRRWQQEGT